MKNQSVSRMSRLYKRSPTIQGSSNNPSNLWVKKEMYAVKNAINRNPVIKLNKTNMSFISVFIVPYYEKNL